MTELTQRLMDDVCQGLITDPCECRRILAGGMREHIKDMKYHLAQMVGLLEKAELDVEIRQNTVTEARQQKRDFAVLIEEAKLNLEEFESY